jgi:hypothetical protein
MELASVARVTIIGGGLFPRSVLVLQQLVPEAHLTIVDFSAYNVSVAQSYLAKCGVDASRVSFRIEPFRGAACDSDLVVAPLAFVGERSMLNARSQKVGTVVHEWCWRRSSSRSVMISALLFKRLSLLAPKNRELT